MSDFFDDWIFSPGYSDYFINGFDYNEAISELTIRIGQNQYESDHYHQNTPLPITLFLEDGSMIDMNVMASGVADTITLRPIGARPTSIAVNRGHRMNMAMFEGTVSFDETGIHQDGFAGFQFNHTVIDSQAMLTVEHHLTTPTGSHDDMMYELSEDHFWHVAGHYEDFGDDELRFFIDRNSQLTPDLNVIGFSEDSLVLMYRPDDQSDWLPHPDYDILKLIPTDGRAIFIVNDVLLGDYAFGKQLDGFVHTIEVSQEEEVSDVLCYPNPVSNVLRIESEEGIRDIELYDTQAHSILRSSDLGSSSEIDMTNQAPGTYYLKVRLESGAMITNTVLKL